MVKQNQRALRRDLAGVRLRYIVRTDHLSFRFSPNTKDSKITCAVSKKVSKTAVERNRFKRWCRESVRTHLHILERPAVGIVLLEKKEPKLSYTMIEGEIKRLYIQAHGRLIPRRKVQ